MKKLGFVYTMDLYFDNDITQHNFSLRCLPKNSSTQKIYSLDYKINPTDHIRESLDCFQNRILVGDCIKQHNSFSFEVSGIAWVDSSNIQIEELDPIYKYPSQYTRITEDIIEFYNNMLFEGNNLQRALLLMNKLFDAFKYIPGSTTIATTAAEALILGSGVCQDYAHILIALCRLNKIPARYVAGLICGEGATHAWVEIYNEGYWIGIDPTSNILVNDCYIKLSHGRDYYDCTIDKGIFKGNVNQYQHINVNVKQLI